MRPFIALLLVGCSSYEEADFIPRKTELFCAKFLECADDALLRFDGQDEARCVSTYGPIFQDEQAQCKLVVKSAKKCIADMETMTCPSEGTDAAGLAANLPAACAATTKKCSDEPPATEPEPTDAPTDDTGS